MESNEVTDLFKALSHPIRVEILDQLKNGPISTGELSEKFDVTRYAVMKHLDVLVTSGLVVVRRKGRLRLNYLNAIPLQQMYNRWVSKYEANAAHSLTNLKAFVEGHEGRNNMDKLQISSFQIEQEIVIDAPKETVYRALTEQINEWWAFRLGGTGSTLIFEPKLNGRFYEEWGNGEGAIWGTVLFIKENEEIRLSGLLGMKGAVNSHYSYKLEEKGSSTVIKLTHDAVGLLEPQWEDAHRHGWSELLDSHLREFLKRG